MRIAVHVGKHPRRDHAHVTQHRGIGGIEHEPAVDLAEQPRRGRHRIAQRQGARADEQVEGAIGIVVAQRDRSGGRFVRPNGGLRRRRPRTAWQRHADGGRLGDHVGLGAELPGSHTGNEARARTGGHAEDGREICRGQRSTRGLRHHRAAARAEQRHASPLSGADDQILGAITIDVKPRHARAELRQRLRQQKLPIPVIEAVLDVTVSPQLRGGIGK